MQVCYVLGVMMQFESKQKRSLWINLTLGFVPDVIISIVVAIVLSGGILLFFATLIGLQCIYLLIWIKNSVWGWTLYKLHHRKYLVEHLTDYLKTNKYPEPDDYEKSADGYLTSVMSNEKLPVDIRIKAASCLAELNFMSTQGQLQNYLRFSMAYEAALADYKKTFQKSS
jgi:hypothetical protein